jgi:hypothetical protein
MALCLLFTRLSKSCCSVCSCDLATPQAFPSNYLLLVSRIWFPIRDIFRTLRGMCIVEAAPCEECQSLPACVAYSDLDWNSAARQALPWQEGMLSHVTGRCGAEVLHVMACIHARRALLLKLHC